MIESHISIRGKSTTKVSAVDIILAVYVTGEKQAGWNGKKHATGTEGKMAATDPQPIKQ